VAGAVLVGGASRRMGRPKPVLEVGGVPMADRVAAALRQAGCAPVHFVGSGPLPAGDEPLRVPDRWPGAGPLGGVITALLHAGSDVVVAACDLPDLDPDTVRAVLAAPGAPDVAVVVATTARLEPALARWNRRAVGPLRELFEAGERALHVALDGLDAAGGVVRVAVDPAALRNVNTPGDLGE
jgi:molybdopterin-guanine dinucleotide biosynthesis protein A